MEATVACRQKDRFPGGSVIFLFALSQERGIASQSPGASVSCISQDSSDKIYR